MFSIVVVVGMFERFSMGLSLAKFILGVGLIFDTLKDGLVDLAVVAHNLFAFFGQGEAIDNRIGVHLVLRHATKQRVLTKVLEHPVVEIFDIGGKVRPATDRQQVRVLGQQLRRYDAPLVLLLLKVWIGKQEEHGGELAFVDVVGQIFHCIAA